MIYWIGILLGIVIGFLFAISLIDDVQSFKVPFTDKVFVRELTTEGNEI